MIDCKTIPVRRFYKQSTIKLKLSLSIKVSKQPTTSSLSHRIFVFYLLTLFYIIFISQKYILLSLPKRLVIKITHEHVCYHTVRCTGVKECLKVWAVSQFWPVEGDLLHHRPTWRTPRSISKPPTP